MQRPARTRFRTRRAQVSRNERGVGFDAEAGFTIIEVVVASSLLLVAFLGAAGLFEEGTHVSGDTRQRVVAAQLASAAIEKVRGPAADPALFTSVVAPGETVSTQTVNGLKFTVTQDEQWVNQTATTSSCQSAGAGGSNAILQVTESVTWLGAGATAPVASTTVLSPPAGAYSTATGSIAVQVLNAAGLPEVNTAVSISGASAQTQSTTAEGCAFFAFLTPGAYTVKVTAGTGVGDQEVLIPSQSTSVTVGQTSSLTFNYDTAATISITGWTGPSVATPATNIPIGIANTGLQPYSMYSYATGSTSLTPLFPYPSGYTVFAGNCTDNNPNGLDTTRNKFYNNPGTTTVSVSPGGTVTTAVPLYDMPVTVVNSASVPVVGATLTMTETTYSNPQPAATPVCTSGGASGAAPTLGLVTTGAGGLSTTAVPLGHWTISATSGTKHGTAKVWRKVTGLFNVTSTGTSTGSAITTITVTVS
jgi:Tfp pilus assembly protein PilV